MYLIDRDIYLRRYRESHSLSMVSKAEKSECGDLKMGTLHDRSRVLGGFGNEIILNEFSEYIIFH